MTNIVTLYPYNVELGGNDFRMAADHPLPAPATFGGGDVDDDSDTSWVEIGTRYDGTAAPGNENYCDILLADFHISAALDPQYMIVSLRAKNESTGDPVWESVGLPRYAFYRADDPTGDRIYYQNWPDDLQAGAQTVPAWFTQFYTGAPMLPGEPSRDTNWANIPEDWPEMLDPLTTTGLRLGIFAESASPVRVPLLDVYEVRLLVACPSTTRRRAHLRQYPRSPLRKWPPERSVQRSNRQGPGAYR